MKNGLKMLWSILFLAIFLPYTAILLMNGRQGVSREEKLPDREYQVLAGLLQEDLSWMDEETLCLMAVLIPDGTGANRNFCYGRTTRCGRQHMKRPVMR